MDNAPITSRNDASKFTLSGLSFGLLSGFVIALFPSPMVMASLLLVLGILAGVALFQHKEGKQSQTFLFLVSYSLSSLLVLGIGHFNDWDQTQVESPELVSLAPSNSSPSIPEIVIKPPVFEAPTYYPPKYPAPVYREASAEKAANSKPSIGAQSSQEDEPVFFNSSTERSFAKELSPQEADEDLVQMGYRYQDTEEDALVRLGQTIQSFPEDQQLALYYQMYEIISAFEVVQKAKEKEGFCATDNPNVMEQIFAVIDRTTGGQKTTELVHLLEDVICLMQGQE
ncbi:MAG: DUF1427 family protein [Bacteroidota bacterium]